MKDRWELVNNQMDFTRVIMNFSQAQRKEVNFIKIYWEIMEETVIQTHFNLMLTKAVRREVNSRKETDLLGQEMELVLMKMTITLLVLNLTIHQSKSDHSVWENNLKTRKKRSTYSCREKDKWLKTSILKMAMVVITF